MEEQRPNPNVLLRNLAENQSSRGRLKIFFGYAAGVGKTFAMLSAAHEAKNAGMDVVCGYIEPHTRPETMALLAGLEALPTMTIAHKNIVLKELDLDGALRRHPQLLLVDELAHSNPEGCRHRKRYQDIEELLTAGIDVYTTVNVQHIESLNDLVASITGVTVRERVPDSVFDTASQVELVDIEPDDLIGRLNRGKIYGERQAQKALDHFFTRDNLAALREIALRRTADRLNRGKEQSGEERNPTDEHILICLSSSPSNAKVIRAGARLREAFHGRFTALFVETPDTRELSEE
ncbi:MAG: histidine kinase, partial [Pseudoflavonifractor sp.]